MKNGPIGKVLQCRQCKFRVHAGRTHIVKYIIRISHIVHSGSCGAIVDPSAVEKWVCELCENEKTLEASVVRTQILYSSIEIIADCALCLIEFELSSLPARKENQERQTY